MTKGSKDPCATITPPDKPLCRLDSLLDERKENRHASFDGRRPLRVVWLHTPPRASAQELNEARL